MGGTLEIILLHGQNLKDVDWMGKRRPYCVLSIGDRKTKSSTHTDGGINPVWNQTFTFPGVNLEETLHIEVYDKHNVRADVLIGTCELVLASKGIGKNVEDVVLPVMSITNKRHRGDIALRLVHRQSSVAPTALGVVDLQGTPSIKQPLPPPTTGYVPGTWILPTYKDTHCWQDYESCRVLLGSGTYSTTYQAVHRTTQEQVAIKVINKLCLGTPEEVEGVQREVQVMHHLAGHSNVVKLINVYEDETSVCLVMELCAGGGLLDAIVVGTRSAVHGYSERAAARLMRSILGVVAHCHSMGVVHRDLRPENFLLSDESPEPEVKLANFGLSAFFQEGKPLTTEAGSIFYAAPEVRARSYGKEADIWSCGVILYILLCGTRPFKSRAELSGKHLDTLKHFLPNISEPARDCVRRMLCRDPSQRAPAVEILTHEWMRENGAALDTPLEPEVLTRLKHFSGMNKLKKEARRVIAGNLPLDEISGLREMFIEIDADKSGRITADELKTAVRNKGQAMSQAEVAWFLEAADMNDDGIIDYEEFLAATVSHTKTQREEHLRDAFKRFDKDCSGHISREELAQALRECQLTEQQVEATMEELDQDGDGHIDYNEFCHMMRIL